MDNKKYKKGITDIYKRIDCLTAMASLDEIDISSVLIELEQLNAQVIDIDEKIKAYTPTSADLNASKNNDQVRLSTLEIQLSERDSFVELDDSLEKAKSNKNELTKQVEKFETYKSNSREFKMFVNENKHNIDILDKQITSLQSEKKRSSNSIQVLSEKRDALNNEIEQITKEAEKIKFNLSSDKNYADSTLVQSKKRRR